MQPSHPAASVLNRMRTNWSETDCPSLAVSVMVQRLARLLEQKAGAALAAFDLSLMEFEVLATIRSYPPPHRLTPTELYGALLISSGGLTKVLKTLERRHLIERLSDKVDRRFKPLQLTAEGRHLAEQGMQVILAGTAPSFADLSASDLRLAEQTLEEITRRSETGLPSRDKQDIAQPK